METSVLDATYQQHLRQAIAVVAFGSAPGVAITRFVLLRGRWKSLNWVRRMLAGGLAAALPPAAYLVIALWMDYLRTLEGVQ